MPMKFNYQQKTSNFLLLIMKTSQTKENHISIEIFWSKSDYSIKSVASREEKKSNSFHTYHLQILFGAVKRLSQLCFNFVTININDQRKLLCQRYNTEPFFGLDLRIIVSISTSYSHGTLEISQNLMFSNIEKNLPSGTILETRELFQF